ncbi:unnamed protein product [Ectocarpus sp. CCAP 1310/34]|nr:unnamed protein product [Ectocarpus sp. CCAP 1310/34]
MSTTKLLMEVAADARSKGNFPKAQEYLLRVVRTNPNNKQAWEELGQCYLETGSLENSLEAYRRAVALTKGSDEDSASGK